MRLFNRVNYFSKGRVGRSETKRTLLQFVFAAMANPHFKGFLDGRIYNGSSKAVCVPGLNCYSCPGAAGACPIGSLQAIIGSPKYTVSLYVMGLLMLFGTLLGRLVCGFLCVFGLVQDLLFKIPTPKFKLSKAVDSKLRYLKYVVLIVMVIALPMFLTNRIGIAPPYFCKYLCPAGTIEAAFPLLAKNPFLRETIGHIFFIKLSILIVVVLSSIFVYRPFCKYLCPITVFLKPMSYFSSIMGKGGSTFCCRPLITHQQGQAGLSTVGVAHLLAVDWLGWICYLYYHSCVFASCLLCMICI